MGYIVFRFPKERVKEALRGIISSQDITGRKLALVKPNICGFYPPDLTLLRSLIEVLLERFEKVIIGETPSTMHDPEERFKTLGILDLVREFPNVIALDMTRAEVIKVKVPSPHAVKTLPLPKCLYEANYIVNLARAGSHPSTKVTIALKNLFGFIAEKRKYLKYHIRGISKVIADVAKVVHPNLNIVEVGTQVLASKDPLSLDLIAAKEYMGVDPRDVLHFRLTASDKGEKVGELLAKIVVKDL